MQEGCDNCSEASPIALVAIHSALFQYVTSILFTVRGRDWASRFSSAEASFSMSDKSPMRVLRATVLEMW